MDTILEFLNDNWGFIKENWVIITAVSGFLFEIIRKSFSKFNLYKLKNDNLIKDLELVGKYFSAEAIKKLDKEPRLIQEMTCNVVPILRGLTYKEVKKLIKADFKDKNLYIFLDLYRNKYIDEQGNLIDDGKNKLKKSKLFKTFYILAFILWMVVLALVLAKAYPLPFSSMGWLILLFGVSIPEFALLNYLEKIRNLKKFE